MITVTMQVFTDNIEILSEACWFSSSPLSWDDTFIIKSMFLDKLKFHTTLTLMDLRIKAWDEKKHWLYLMFWYWQNPISYAHVGTNWCWFFILSSQSDGIFVSLHWSLKCSLCRIYISVTLHAQFISFSAFGCSSFILTYIFLQIQWILIWH